MLQFLPMIAGGVSALGKGVLAFKQMREAGKIKPEFVPYQESKYAKSMLGTSLNAYNGRNPASVIQEQNIQAAQGNAMNSISRNATDSSQLLALAGGVQANTDSAMSDLRSKDAQERYGMLNVLNNAYQTMINEGDKVYQSKMDKFKIDTEQKAALRGSAMNNIFSGIQDVAGGAMSTERIKGDKAYLEYLKTKKG